MPRTLGLLVLETAPGLDIDEGHLMDICKGRPRVGVFGRLDIARDLVEPPTTMLSAVMTRLGQCPRPRLGCDSVKISRRC